MSISCISSLAEELTNHHGWRYKKCLSDNGGTEIETHLLEVGNGTSAVLKVPSTGGPKNNAFERAYRLREAAGGDLDGFAPPVLQMARQNLGYYTQHPYALVGYVEGRQVSPAIRYKESEPGVRVQAAFRYATGALRTLAGFHARGLVHGDVKPTNLVHNPLDPSRPMTLIDLDTMAQEGDPTRFHALNNYSAPEVLRSTSCHPATDIFPVACGVVDIMGGKLHELLPIVGANPRESLRFKLNHLPFLTQQEAELQIAHRTYPEEHQAMVQRLVRFIIPGLNMNPFERPNAVTALDMCVSN